MKLKLLVLLAITSVLLNMCGTQMLSMREWRIRLIQAYANKIFKCQNKYNTPDSNGIVVEGELRTELDDAISRWREEYEKAMEMLEANYFDSKSRSVQHQIKGEMVLIQRHGQDLSQKCEAETQRYREDALQQNQVPLPADDPNQSNANVEAQGAVFKEQDQEVGRRRD